MHNAGASATQLRQSAQKTNGSIGRYFQDGRIPRTVEEARERLKTIQKEHKHTSDSLNCDTLSDERRRRKNDFLKHTTAEIQKLTAWIKTEEAKVPKPLSSDEMIIATLKRLGEENKTRPLSPQKLKVHDALAEYAALA